MTGLSFEYHGYGAAVRVDVPENVHLARLAQWIAPEVIGELCAGGNSDFLLTRWRGEYRLTLGDRRYGPYDNIDDALRGLSNGVHFLLGMRSPMTFLHAGAVEIDGEAVVFPGRSRWGKSTLVERLVDEGCGYMSDEYAVISPEGTVFPLAKPIRIRTGDGTRATYRCPTGVGAPGGLPCSALILTRYRKKASWSPVPLTLGNAVLRTLPSALRSNDAAEKVLTSLTAMGRTAAFYEGPRGEGEPTADDIRALQRVRDSQIEARA